MAMGVVSAAVSGRGEDVVFSEDAMVGPRRRRE